MSLDESADTPPEPISTVTPGELLREGRVRAGLSQDDIAAKLKLSTRQVSAIETSDWSALPERTFTRGFMRSYARLVDINPDTLELQQAQPNTAAELRPTPEGIGEIVHDADRNSMTAARWWVPGLLIAALAVGAAYFHWGHLIGLPGSRGLAGTPAPSLKSAVAAKAGQATESTATSSGAVIAPINNAASTVSGATVPPSALPVAATTETSAASTPAATTAPAPTTVPLLNPAEKRIVLSFKGKSWTEVRSNGEVIFSETATPGIREFVGAPPLSFTVGNASNVTVSIDGKPFDMAELTRNDVARFRVE